MKKEDSDALIADIAQSLMHLNDVMHELRNLEKKLDEKLKQIRGVK